MTPALRNVVLLHRAGGPPVNGTAIGQAGTGIFAGLKLADGDDFDTQPSRWSARNPTGRYSCGHLSHATRGSSSFDTGMMVDPAWRGGRSESPTDLNIDRISVANSILTMTAAVPEAQIVAFLPTTYTSPRGDSNNRPYILTAALKTGPSFKLSAQADWALACKVKFPAGTARGFWPSFWASTAHWPDYGEVDVMEGKKNSGNIASTTNVIGSATDGGGTEVYGVNSPPVAPDRWVTYVAVKKNGLVTAYDDIDVEGTLAARGSKSELNARLRGAWDVRLNFAIDVAWDGTTFNAADWPKIIQYDWWQAWVPLAAGSNSPSIFLDPVFTTAGGSWASTFPSKVALFGSAAGIEQVHGGWDNEDAPGANSWSSATILPGNLTVDLTARTTSGTVELTNGGRFFLCLVFGHDDGTPAKRAYKPFNVAPVFKTLFSDTNINSGDPLALTVNYTDFHSGNLGHTYNVAVTGGSAGWINIAGNGTSAVTLTGTGPDANTTLTVTVTATNSVGQQTVATRQLQTFAAGSPPNDLALLFHSEGAVDGASFTFSGSLVGSGLIVAAGVYRAATAITLTGVTIGGVAATVDIETRNTSNGVSSAWIAHAVVSGVQADVVLNLSGTAVRAGVAVYRSTIYASAIPTKTGTATRAATAGSMSPTLTAPDTGFQIGVAFSAASTNHMTAAASAKNGAVSAITITAGATSSAWTGLTEDVDTLIETSGAGAVMSASAAGWKYP